MPTWSRVTWGQIAWTFFGLAIACNIVDARVELAGAAWTAVRVLVALAWLTALAMWWRLRSNDE